jgi:hypothetical protein
MSRARRPIHEDIPARSVSGRGRFHGRVDDLPQQACGHSGRPGDSAIGGQLSGLVSGSTNDYLAGMPGAIGDSARRNQRTSAAVVAQRERVTRRPMADCVKPGPLIDLDVKECMDGMRVKDW